MRSARGQSSARFSLLPIVILSVGLVISIFAAIFVYQSARKETKMEFDRGTQRLSQEITRRFQLPVYGLNGIKSIVNARKSISRVEFQQIIAARDLPTEFPGVHGFGLIYLVAKSEVSSFVEQEQWQGAADFHIKSLGDNQFKDAFIITYIEPLKQNKSAVGLDVGTEAKRRETIQAAIDTGEVRMTPPLQLVQAEKKDPWRFDFSPGF